jgi:hypothetical protein
MSDEVDNKIGNEDLVGGSQILTREELYALVWQTPLSRLAKRFGLSDVGPRKICVKHGISTPPLGYWAKLAHGKPVRQPPLPPAGDGGTSTIHIVLRTGLATPPPVAAAQKAALTQESMHPSIIVPAKLPAKLHPVAAATARALRQAKVDDEGFKHGAVAGGVNVTIGLGSIDRALCIIDAFARAIEERGHSTKEHDGCVRIVVDGVSVGWRLYAIKDRVPHQPTKEELKAQARHEENRARWPTLYSSRSDAKVHPSWDYLPSSRLAMTLTDTTRSRWNRQGLIGHWHNRKSQRLEGYLDSATAALVAGAIAIKYRLADEMIQERRRVEELERRRREQARHERAIKRHEFILGKADDYARFERLARFAEFMEREVYQYSEEPVDRLVGELTSIIKVMREGFGRNALQEEIAHLQLYTDDDHVVDSVDE